ncbi:anti-anti-sigma factor [Actinomadura pelletieri DSM 43383]|uniref:Anti-sigma factor antagonist n=1 Tax=Actinomadura pelletieri DSM 43383 TaxID=1120940 RepID=A0A495QXE2_9ACTN|nr:STAS domain-containing protein [Actinomadura pelletieri]RKS78802.1 anti-anti-sigma factor [Actinomadura pelletieri DSM 43383]
MATHDFRQDTYAEFATSLNDTDAGARRVVVSGELDIASAGVLRSHLARLIDERGPNLVVDVSALTFCDAQGLAAFVAADELAHRHGGAVTLVGIRPQLAKILRITGLDRRFTCARAGTHGG